MAIQFARCEYVSRSSGGNACRKASYNQRESVRCERTGELFSFKERNGNVHHEILLPLGADEKFKNSSVLWNEVEACERRINSQLAKEFVIALPDNPEVTLEDRIELTRRFGQIFVNRGVGVQLDVHSPHDGERNWHAHLLVTTRRFSEDGLTFGAKARDLDPVVRRGVVVEADIWGEIWRDLQNTYFEEKGYDIKVDPIGLVPQEHLGPVRMRHHLNEAISRAQLLERANQDLAKSPLNVLEEITRIQSVFTKKDLDIFIQKFISSKQETQELIEKIFQGSTIVPLYDKKTKEETGFFTTEHVRGEEEKLVRFADNISKKSAICLTPAAIEKGLEGRHLSNEQKTAYNLCVNSGKNLSIIQGRAGVGKSYLLDAIRIAHTHEGFRVLGLAPTHKVATDLRTEGFESKTFHSFLFAYKNNREKVDTKTVIVVDEAGMLGTTLLVELFNAIKNNGAKLILVGDDRQLSSVERGGIFKFLSERYGAIELSEVRRQTVEWQKSVSESLSQGDIKTAVHLLEDNKALFWNPIKEESLSNLLKNWAKDAIINPQDTRQIIAQRNIDVDTLNQGAREILRKYGQLGDVEIICSTQRGRMAFTIGDRVQFTKTDKEQGILNGSFGIIKTIDPKAKNITIQLDNGDIKDLNPNIYDGLRHGYAATVYKTQGATLDSVYVLHSKTTNQATSYVSLTRQTKSLSVYISQDETPSLRDFIRQIENRQEKGTSLVFDTLKDIEKDGFEKKPFFPTFKEKVEILFTKVKDMFHRNETFYNLERQKSLPQEPAVISTIKEFTPIQNVSERFVSSKSKDILGDIAKRCEEHLYNYVEKESISLTSQLMERIPLQAERAAHFILYAHILNGREHTEKETRLYLLRAKYELNRIPQIKEKLTREWYKKGNIDEKKDPLLIHMIAERHVSIEGRLYLEAKRTGHKPSPFMSQIAEAEFKKHRIETKSLAQKLMIEYSLSKEAAKEFAKNIFRYQEAHGTKPTTRQKTIMAEITREFDKKFDTSSTKQLDSYHIAYMRRIEGDSLFRFRCLENRTTISLERQMIKTQEKASLEIQKQQTQQEISRQKERDFSLSM
ncbi:MAG: AAA family ATPase [Proteobacteria bacterium]|nr:AAA family ATPase [Pseudomonadota bacterium]